MKRFLFIGMLVLGAADIALAQAGGNSPLFQYKEGWKSRWSSPENRDGIKGAGGKENNGAKGHPFDTIGAGKSLTLLDIHGTGIINRIWLTLSDQSARTLRGLKIEMFWDNEKKPAVSVPLGDFFGVGLGRKVAFQNALFADPEGRSFNCFIPMPFKKGARIIITNETSKRIDRCFFDVDYNLIPQWDNHYLYLHAYWHRDTATEPARDFELLPAVQGRGRFLGVNISVMANPSYPDSWWGEGEVKVYLDGDTHFPTLAGTGTEDYIGTAWGQGKFINDYTGCLIADDSLRQWSFYRYHIPDPIFFDTDCRVTIQQMGGTFTEVVAKYQHEKIPAIPTALDENKGGMHGLYIPGQPAAIDTTVIPKTWINFYRQEDIASVAYFYLDTPVNELPAIQPPAIRIHNLIP